MNTPLCAIVSTLLQFPRTRRWLVTPPRIALFGLSTLMLLIQIRRLSMQERAEAWTAKQMRHHVPLSRVSDTAAMPFALGLHDEVTLRHRHTAADRDKEKEKDARDKRAGGEKGTAAEAPAQPRQPGRDSAQAGGNHAESADGAVKAEPRETGTDAPQHDSEQQASKQDTAHKGDAVATDKSAASNKEASCAQQKDKQKGAAREDGGGGEAHDKPAAREKPLVGHVIEVAQHDASKAPEYTIRCGSLVSFICF